jgi:hypothetical protein
VQHIPYPYSAKLYADVGVQPQVKQHQNLLRNVLYHNISLVGQSYAALFGNDV